MVSSQCPHTNISQHISHILPIHRPIVISIQHLKRLANLPQLHRRQISCCVPGDRRPPQPAVGRPRSQHRWRMARRTASLGWRERQLPGKIRRRNRLHNRLRSSFKRPRGHLVAIMLILHRVRLVQLAGRHHGRVAPSGRTPWCSLTAWRRRRIWG